MLLENKYTRVRNCVVSFELKRHLRLDSVWLISVFFQEIENQILVGNPIYKCEKSCSNTASEFLWRHSGKSNLLRRQGTGNRTGVETIDNLHKTTQTHCRE